MHGHLASGILAASLLVAAPLAAEEPAGPGSVEELDWLSGCWRMSDDGRVVEECWLEPGGGMMLGIGRTVEADGSSFFEFLRIADSDEGPIYWASPRGREAVPFRVTESGPGRATFENPKHDFPQRLAYDLDDEGRLHVKISGLGSDVQGPGWIFEKAGRDWE